MWSVSVRAAGVAVIISLLSACAHDGRLANFENKRSDLGGNCDVASGTATTFNRAKAEAHATANLESDMDALKGRMIAAGLRRVQVVDHFKTCKPGLSLTGGVRNYYCKLEATLCGS
ncbi:MAG: hypothetical protein AAFR04_12795 [Pseudomonadota bacterium]